MKKMKWLLLPLLLCLVLSLPAMAQEEEAWGGLTQEELTSWAQGMMETALENKDKAVISPAPDGGYMAVFDGFTLYMTSDDLSSDTTLTGVRLSVDADVDEVWQDPRGVMPTNDAALLISLYRNDNAHLSGTREGAVLYMDGTLPGTASAGSLVRDGQHIQLIEYDIYSSVDGGVRKCGLTYTVQDGFITDITAFGFCDVMPLQEAQQELNNLSLLQEENAYFSYDTVTPERFVTEDLSFDGLDFLSLTPESAQSVLGKAASDEWLDDDNGEKIRTMQWDDVQITFVYSADKTLLRTDALNVNGASVEAMRGIVTGDRYAVCAARFENNGLYYRAGTQYLYGAENDAEYAISENDGASALLRYVLTAGENQIMLMLSFENGHLVSLMLFYL